MKILTIVMTILALSGCGTMKVNKAALDQYADTLTKYQMVQQDRADAASKQAEACTDDACRIAVVAITTMGNQLSGAMPEMPTLRYPSQDWANFGNFLLQAGQTVAVPIVGIRQSNQTTRAITASNNQTVTSVTGMLTDMLGSQPPTTSIAGDLVSVGGNMGDTAGNDIVGGDRIDAGQIGDRGDAADNGSQIGDRGDAADNGSIINNGDFRDTSPGPIEDSGNDNSDNSDNSNNSDNSSGGGL